MSARYWRLYQNSNTRQAAAGYEWHLNNFGIFTAPDGSGANLATTANTTASASKSGKTIANLLSAGDYYIFNSYLAGQVVTVDLGADPPEVESLTYKNAVGSDWAPSSVKVQWSKNGYEWIDCLTYADDGTTNKQTLSGFNPLPVAPYAGYIVTPRRDRFRPAGEKSTYLIQRQNRCSSVGVSLEAAPIYPVGVSGILGWWDISKITGLNDGDAVSLWKGINGGGFLADAAKQPLYKPNIVNGYAALLFADDYMDSSPLAGIKSVCVVASYPAAAFSNYNGLLSGKTAGMYFIGYSGMADWYTAEPVTGAKWYKDGAESAANVTNAWHVFICTTTASPDTILRLGQDRGYSARPWQGYVSEVIVSSETWNAGEIAALTNYLKAKYGIA